MSFSLTHSPPAPATVSLGFEANPAAQRLTGHLLRLKMPRLSGAGTATLLDAAVSVGEERGFQLYRQGAWLAGLTLRPLHADLAETAQSAYLDLFSNLGQHHLCRVWNFVPAINGHVGGFENYRAFSLGRAQAFETVFGAESPRRMSAASAVGSDGGELGMAFLAHEATPAHFENPEQVPAWRYPEEHGPRPPSFARATRIDDAGRRHFFISGTAAIKGHATLAPGELGPQLECTLDNLRLLSRTLDLGERFDAVRWRRRAFKIYVRHAAAAPVVLQRMEQEFPGVTGDAIVLRADICRAELEVEVEARFEEA